MRSATILDNLPMPVWIVFVVLGCVLFWPLGVAVLAYLIWSGKMMCFIGRPTRSKSDGIKRWTVGTNEPLTSGNIAFDEYREATLKRLEQERVEFAEFLDRLRHAKDKAEFDQFMAEQASQQSQN